MHLPLWFLFVGVALIALNFVVEVVALCRGVTTITFCCAHRAADQLAPGARGRIARDGRPSGRRAGADPIPTPVNRPSGWRAKGST